MDQLKNNLIILGLLFTLGLSAQVSVSTTGTTPDPSAMLDVVSTDKGMLIPRMTTAQRTAISTPATGLMVYDNTTNSFWYYTGSAWTELVNGNPSILSDTDGDTKILVEESPDEDAIRFYVENVEAMNIGPLATGTVETASSGAIYGSQNAGWQSFTAPENGNITSIEILYNSAGAYPTKDFKIYDGEGTGGTELADLGSYTLSTGTGWNTIPLSTPISMTTGQKYTLSFSSIGGIVVDFSNPYPDGTSNIANEDFAIRVNWSSSNQSVKVNTPLDVNNTVTATAFVGDGSGLTNLPGDDLGNHTATQSLDLGNNDIINGGTVTATAFVGDGSGLTNLLGDNLGNHTATQNLQLDGNYLSGDGGNEGVFVANNGWVGIGIDAPENKLNVAGSAQLRNGDLVFTNNYGGNSTLLRKSRIENDFNIALNSASLQSMVFNVNDGSPSGANEVLRLWGDLRANFAGNVGIGTTTPTSRLDVAGGNISMNGGWISNDGGNEGISINNSGNVGIGTSTPQAKLDINAQGDGAEVLKLGTERPWIFQQDGTGSNTALRLKSIGTGANSDFFIETIGKTHFKTVVGNGSPTKVLIDHAQGHLGIGTTSPSSPLHIVSSFNNTTMVTLTHNGTSNANVLKVSSGSTGTTDIIDIQNGAFVVEGNGNVGIGTTNPDRAKLQVLGQSGSFNISYGYLNSSGNTGTGSGASSYSIYASNRIAAQEFRAHSDMRIKDIEGVSNTKEDLQTLMQIEITDYTLRDTVASGKTFYKKVIAQQVAEVYPQAVSNKLTEVVPDIYQKANLKNGWIELSTDLHVGERVKIITEEATEIYEVVEVEDARFRVNSTFINQHSAFIYGREVDDFHTVDYEAIAMLNVSATQEQQRIIEAQQKEIDALKAQLQNQESSFEQRIARLEALISSN